MLGLTFTADNVEQSLLTVSTVGHVPSILARHLGKGDIVRGTSMYVLIYKTSFQ